MKQFGKTTIWSMILILSAVVLATTAATTLAKGGTRVNAQQTTGEEPLRTISVTGIGRVGQAPDTAVLRLGVETESEMAAEALDQNNTTAEAILDAVTGAGVAAEDVQTQAINLFPRYEQQPDTPGRGELVGYTARHVLRIRVADIDTVGEVLDAAVQAGANLVESIQFEISEPDALLADAREAAMADALAQAEQLAGLAEAALGPVLTIQTVGGSRPVEVQESLAVRDSAAISPGTQVIEVQVNVTWMLVSNP